MQLVQEVGYFVGPMEEIPAEAAPMHQEKKARPIVAVPQYSLRSTDSKRAVVEPDFVRPMPLPVAARPGFAHPMGRVVVEPASVPIQEFVAAEPDFVRPMPLPVAARPGFAH